MMGGLASYLSGRLPFEIDLEVEQREFIRNLSNEGEQIHGRLPVGGFYKQEKSFLYKFDDETLIVKSNVPLLNHVWFLPGGARFKGKFVRQRERTTLQGYFEPSHYNNLNKVFFYSIIGVIVLWMFRELQLLGADLASYLRISAISAFLIFLVPVFGWVHLCVFQKQHVANIKNWLANQA